MRRTWGFKASTLAVLLLLGGAGVSLAAVPPPPVNQILGVPDTLLNALTEADCRFCHDSGLPDRHHVLYGTPIREGVCNDQGIVCQIDEECQLDTCNTQTGFCNNQPSISCSVNGNADCQNDYCIRDSQAPYAPLPPSGDFECLTCHTTGGPGGFVVFRDCLVCHATEYQPDAPDRPQEPNVHHRTEAATSLDCTACHGDLVDNWDDGHYVPTYAPSLVTPWPSQKTNGGPNGEGNCNFCHDAGTEGGLEILDNHDTHHGTGLTYLTLPSPPFGGSRGCYLCHPEPNGRPNRDAYDIRTCERCHGPASLHNIQVDSDGDGTIVVGGEDPYYGHVGNDDDCFGCHGFAVTASIAPFSGPVIPYVASADRSVMSAGSGADVTLTGVAFTNLHEGDEFISNASWTMPDGTVISLDPASVSQSQMVVSVPSSNAGNYTLRATKDTMVSNPTVVTVKPLVKIGSVNCSGGTVSVTGSGFSGYVPATDSGTGITSVIGGAAETGSVVSWTDNQIVADFSDCGDSVEVSSVFGSATALLNPAGACTSSVVGAGPESTSKSAGALYILLLPLGALLFLKIRRRSK